MSLFIHESLAQVERNKKANALKKALPSLSSDSIESILDFGGN
jgi:hypothetical protein